MQPIKLMGILEMAGSFQVNIQKNDKYGSGYSVSIGFILVTKDALLRFDIMKTLVGLNIESKMKGDKLIVNGLKNILIFNEFITNYGGFCSDSRKFTFKQFEKIVEEIDCEQHHHVDGVNKIRKIKNEMKGGK